MHIRKLDLSTFQPSYGALSKKLYPSPESGDTPFSMYWALIEPGGASQIHRHHEGETFLIVKGSGVMTVGDESQPVGVGDVIFMDPLVDHTIANTSDSEQLLFIDVYWEDIKLLLKEDDGETTDDGVKTLAYIAPPGAGEELSLGQLSGPVLAADMYARHRRLLGDSAHVVFATGDHRLDTAVAAKRRGETPQETADHFAQTMDVALNKVRVECGHFFRPSTSAVNRKLTDTLVQTLHENGHLVAKETDALWCEVCELYPAGSQVTGTCPHCHEDSHGDVCTNCGMPNHGADLIDPKCVACGGAPVKKPLRRLFFPLEVHRTVLETYYRKVSMPSRHHALILRLMGGELPDIVASHPGEWGIPVAVDGFEGQVVSTWLEAVPNYLAAAAETAEKATVEGGWKAFWASDDARVVQFLTQDNSWSHGMLYPAVLKAFDGDATPPMVFVTLQSYSFDDAVSAADKIQWTRALMDSNSSDTVRAFAAYSCAEAAPTTYSHEEFANFVNQELIGKWQTWLASLQGRMTAAYDDVIPEAGSWTGRHLAFLKRLKSLLDQAAEAYSAEEFSPQRVMQAAGDVVRLADAFGKSEEAWAHAPSAHNERRTAFALELAAVRTLAMMTQPVMPDFSARLWKSLGYDTPLTAWETEPHFVTPGNMAKDLDGGYFPAPAVETSAVVVA